MNTADNFAFNFLCKRNVLSDTHDQSDYVFLLMEFERIHGAEGLKKLAGFYCFVIDHKKDAKAQIRALQEVFYHDLMGASEKGFLPRSDDYLEYWNIELEKHQLVN